MDRILFLTGRLAKDSLETTLKSIDPPAFSWEIYEIGLQVAGLMTADMIERRLEPARYAGFDKIIVPGRCRGDLKILGEKLQISILRGPDELKDIPMAPEWEINRKTGRYYYKGLNKKDLRQRQWGYRRLAGEDPHSWISKANMMNLEASALYGELDGGKDIYPSYDHPKSSDGAPVWELFDGTDGEDAKVFAAPMSHGIPCVGYVVEESSKPGRLRDDIVKPIVERNVNALKEAGFNIPMKAMAVIKNLPVGSAFTFPDGTVLTQEEAVEPPRKGRKVVICGDTASSRALEGLSMDADVLVHEATNSYLAGIDKDTDLAGVTRDAVIHGHSTPYIAGDFAKKIRAKKLLLNHFSARYKGDQSIDSLSIMYRIEGQAQKASGLNETQVAATWDMMIVPVPNE